MEADEVLERLQRAFQATKCGSLTGRDEEIAQLHQFIEQHLRTKRGGALYVSGAPGTGKTASVLHTLEASDLGGATTFYLNCTRLQRSEHVFGEVTAYLNERLATQSRRRHSVRSLGAGCTRSECSYEALKAAAQKANEMFVLVLDEVDYLMERGGRRKSVARTNRRESLRRTDVEGPSMSFVLGALLQLAMRSGSRLVLVAISNNLNLLDAASDLPGVFNTTSGQMESDENVAGVQRLQFSAYSSSQIVSILRSRLSEFECAEAFEPGALLLIARRVCAESGDVRRALDCALHTAQHAARASTPLNGAWKVTVRDANAAWTSLQNRSAACHFVLSQSLSSNVADAAPQTRALPVDANANEIVAPTTVLDAKRDDCSDFLSAIPIQQKVILCSLVKLVDSAHRNEVTTDELYSVYRQVSNATRIERLSASEFSSSCALLESLGLVALTEASRRGPNKLRQLRVRLLSNVADLRSLLTEFDRTALLNNRILNGAKCAVKRK